MKKIIFILYFLLSFQYLYSQNIIGAEYFFNTDPGVGNGTFINVASSDSVDLNIAIPISALPAGTHNLYVRFLNDNNTWSLHDHRTFFIQNITPTPNIIGAEYFFDTDPGVGNGTFINVTPADSVELITSVSIASLSNGVHNLYIRFLNDDDTWSLHEHRSFYIANVSQAPAITEAEYFFNTDPGVGNGTTISITNPADSVDFSAIVNVPTLPLGTHHFYVRARNSDGVWSLAEPREITICTTYGAVSQFGYILNNNVVTFVDSSLYADTWLWDFGDGSPASNIQNPVHTYNTPGVYTVCLITSNICATDTLCMEVSTITNINETGLQNVIHLYPNPAKEKLILKFNQPVEDVNINLFDLTGRIFYNNKIINQPEGIVEVSLSDFANGVYFLTANYNKEKLITYKLVINR